jgi:hypothetical protein
MAHPLHTTIILQAEPCATVAVIDSTEKSITRKPSTIGPIKAYFSSENLILKCSAMSCFGYTPHPFALGFSLRLRQKFSLLSVRNNITYTA